MVWDKDPDTGRQARIRDIKEQEVYFGDIPLMLPRTGPSSSTAPSASSSASCTARPACFFSQPDKGLFAAQIIPYRGSWVEFEYDSKNLAARAHRPQAQVPGHACSCARSGSKTDAEILRAFYRRTASRCARAGCILRSVGQPAGPASWRKTIHGPKDAQGQRDEIVHAGKKVTAAALEQLRKLEVEEIEVTEARPGGRLHGRRHRRSRARGEVLLEANEPLTASA